MDIQMRMTLSGSIMQMEERLRELEEATARSAPSQPSSASQ